MREILFRGKRIDNGEWVYGVPVIGLTSGVFMVWVEPKAKRGCWDLSIRDVVKQAEVIPETVGQYTGLDDKNGVKIFEGDIIFFEPFGMHNNDRLIQYQHGAFLGKLIRNGYSDRILSPEMYIIIDNIHDNPEVMEELT